MDAQIGPLAAVSAAVWSTRPCVLGRTPQCMISKQYVLCFFTVKFNNTLIVLLNMHLADCKYTPAPLLDTPFEHTLASIGYARKVHFARGPDQSQQGSKIEALDCY